jgi:hypothetical protein
LKWVNPPHFLELYFHSYEQLSVNRVVFAY